MAKCDVLNCRIKTNFKRPQDLKRHHSMFHGAKKEIKEKRTYKKRKSGLSLEDAIIAIKVKRDSFEDIILILENLTK